ncbi:MAG: hypothetical protein K2H36_04520 [Clostridia bacterium]|nr:hypothetical protein [Clostridia bacterium]
MFYMETNLMSPSQLWANYDADAVKLKPNFIKYDTLSNGTVDFEVYLSCEGEDKNTTLTYCYGKIPKQDFKNATLIYINGYTSDLNNEVFDNFLPKGYAVVCFDYIGKAEGKSKYTIYPDSLKYANLAHSARHLDGFDKSPKDSCVFIWSKMCRNVITFIKKLLGEDNKIYLRSSLEGGNILWQVAGMDKRVEGIISANNAGWEESRGLFRFSESPDEFNFSEDKIKWMSACSPQSYAKFVTCPVLFISGTNSSLTSIDRVEKTFALTNNGNDNRACLCSNLTNTMNANAKTSLAIWLDKVYYGLPRPKAPTANFELIDGQLCVKMEFDNSQEIERMVVHYCYNEINSELRHWNKAIISSASPIAQIPVRIGDTQVFAYSSVIYKDGQFYSSLPIMFKLGNAELERLPMKTSHIVYERKNGLDAWVVDNNNGEYYMPELKTGAYDIVGVTAQKGHLATYKISDKKYEHSENSIFQFDCYSPTSRSLYVEMCVEMDVFKYEYYRVEVRLSGEEWQKIALSHNDFKTKELVPLKDWKKVKKLSFLNIDGTLISNIIWV